MKRIIENDFLKVTIDDHGAELVSIYDKEKDREVIWQGDPKFWGRHAPVLFPNVGKHYNNHYRIHGQEYASKQHGFARDTDFTCIDSTPDSVTHQIRSTEDTRKVYPFDFVLRIRHILKGRTLTVSWKVANNSEGDMYFAIGGHPAFNVPVLPDTKRSDYRLTFDGQDSLTTFFWILRPAQPRQMKKPLSNWRMVPVRLMTICLTMMRWYLTTRSPRPELHFRTALLIWKCAAWASRTSESGPLPRTHPLYAWSHGWAAVMTVDLQGIFLKNHLSTI